MANIVQAFGLSDEMAGLVPAIIAATMSYPGDDDGRLRMFYGIAGDVAYRRWTGQAIPPDVLASIRAAPVEPWADFQKAAEDGGADAGRVLLTVLRAAKREPDAKRGADWACKRLADTYGRLPKEARPRRSARTLWARWEKYRPVAALWAAFELCALEHGNMSAIAAAKPAFVAAAQQLHDMGAAYYPRGQKSHGHPLLPTLAESLRLLNGKPWPRLPDAMAKELATVYFPMT